ncbi:MAG: MBG domain-containing protein, partial [Clostridiales bacterium]|nr:MBG domain-containing protein [Clostridiales bacterium]
GSVEKPFKIKPAPVIITAAVVGGTYDGTPRTVSPTFVDQSGDTVNPNFIVTYYQVIGEAETALDSAPKDAGEYKAVVLVEDDDYEGTLSVAFTIAKAKLTVTAKDVTIGVGDPVPATFDYVVDGFLDSESLEEEPILSCSITNSNKPDSYPIVVTGGTAPANYEIEKWVNGTLLVTGKETVSITGAVVGGTYDGTPRTVSPTFADQSGDAVNPKFKVTYYQVIGEAETALDSAPSNAGEYKAVVLVDDDNYDGTRTVTFTIAKAKLTVTAKDVTIGVGETVPATFDYVVDGFLDGESLVDDPLLTCSITNSNKPDSYPIVVTGGTAPANYEIVSRVNGTLLVTGKGIATIKADVDGGTYNGLTRTVVPEFEDKDGTAINPKFIVTYYQVIGEAPTALASAPEDAGEYKAVVLVEDDDYEGTLSVAFTIAKAKLTVTAKDVTIGVGEIVPATFDYVVDGFLDGESLVVAPVLTCSITNSNKPDSYPIVVTGGTAPPNYEIESRVDGTLRVTGKAIATIKADLDGGTYDGTSRTVVPEFEDKDGKSINPKFKVTYYQVIDGADVEIDTAPKDAGEYKAVVLVEDDNYEGTRTVTFTIAKAKLTVKAKDVAIGVGDPLPADFGFEVEGFANGESLEEDPVLTCSITNSNKPGNYPIIVSGGTAPANYEIEKWVNGTLMVTGKETVSITADVVGGTYDGTPRTVNPTFADQSGVAVYPGNSVKYYRVSDGTEVLDPPSDAGDYKAVILVEDPAYEGSYEISFTIAKAKLTVTAKSVTISVGDPVPADFEYAVDGFVNGDSLEEEPVLTCDIVDSSYPESYPIIVTGGTAPANYEIGSRVNGTLLVTGKAIATIIADVVGGTYDGTPRTVNPTFADQIGNAINPGFKVTYLQILDGSEVELGSAPSDAGEYRAVVLVEDEVYDGTLTVTFTIAKAKLTVSAKDVAISVGDPVPTDFEFEVEGFVNGESLGEDPVLTCAIANSRKPGSYPIIVTGGTAPANYEIGSRVNGTLLVTGKEIATIKADVVGGAYDGTPRTVAPEFEDGDGKAINPNYIVIYYQTIDGVEVELDSAPSDAGEYSAAVLVEDDNYNGTLAVAFTIAKAKLKVKALDASISVGQQLPAFLYEVEGFANGESLAEAPVLSCPTAQIGRAGEYPIVVAGGTAPANYEIESWINGTLAIRAIDLPYVPPTVAIPFIPYVPVATPKPTPVDTAPVRLPADIAPIDCAEELHKLGLFAGTSVNAQGVPTYSLEKKLTRIEALALAIRLMGLEKEANEYTGANPFVDVPDWSQKLAAFAYMKGVTVGIDPERGLFGATREVSLQEFAAFLLRALGYSERNGDFLFVEAVNKAASLSVVAKEDEKTSPTTSINRNKAVLLMVATLLANMNGTDQTMLQSLTGSGAVSTDAAASFIAAIRAMNS